MRKSTLGNLAIRRAAAAVCALLALATIVFGFATLQPESAEAAPAKLTAKATKYATPLPKGDYIIVRTDVPAMTVDVSGASKKNGANVQLYASNGTKAQVWRVTYDSQGRYTFINPNSNKALDVRGARMKNSTNIWQYKPNGTLAQKWILVQTSDGYRIESAKNRSFVIDCKGAGVKNGTNIQIYRSNNTKAQRFLFIDANPKVVGGRTIDDGVYTIGTKLGGGRLVEVAGASADAGANVQLYGNNRGTGQRWWVTCGKDGFYTIRSIESGLVLGVAGGLKTPQANIEQQRSNNSDAQKWAIRKNKDGSYTLIGKGSGMAVEVAGGKSANGANIRTGLATSSASQAFTFAKTDPLADGVYVFYSQLGNKAFAVGIKGDSLVANAAAQIRSVGSSGSVRFVLAGRGDGTFTLQSAASGKYLADSNAQPLQLVAANAARPSANMLWRAQPCAGGISLSNVGTGRALGTSAAKAADGAPLALSKYAGKAGQQFRSIRSDYLIDSGLYTVKSAAGAFCLDVSGGSWSNGTNAQIYTSNGSNAQKFAFAQAGSGYYRISMALSGTVLTATGSDVRLNKAAGSDAQLWKPTLTSSGLIFTNKANGRVLSLGATKAANGVNVGTAAPTGAAAQSWYLLPTSINGADAGSIRSLISAAPGSKGGGVKLDAKGTSYKMSSSASKKLNKAIGYAWSRGKDVGFVMVDLQTGITVTLDPNRRIHGASTFKAAYVTYIFQDLLERGKVSWGSVSSLISATIGNSDNDAYAQLRARFGTGGFKSWLKTVGLGHLASEYYPTLTARDLGLVWSKIYSYERSGGRYVGKWRSTFNHSYYSCIREALGGSNTVYSKPGWYPPSGSYTALNDAAIVRDRSGRSYLMVILSNVNCYGDQWIIRDIAKALDAVHREMPAG